VSQWISLLFSHHTRATILSLRVGATVSAVDGVTLDIPNITTLIICSKYSTGSMYDLAATVGFVYHKSS